MGSFEQLEGKETWTATERKAARKAFDKAFERHCAAITAEARRMVEDVTAPSDIWQVQAYLREQRKTVDRICDYRYSILIMVFSRLMGEGWLTEEDLHGLQQEKIASIKRGASLYHR